MMSVANIQVLRELICNCRAGEMVFFGGVGVSIESGIPDFRSPEGLYECWKTCRTFNLIHFGTLDV